MSSFAELPEVTGPWFDEAMCVVCYAPWDLEASGPSRQMLQLVAALGQQHAAAPKCAQMNVQSFESVCAVYEVKVVPTLLLTRRGGHLVAKAEGVLKAADLAAFLDKAGQEDLQRDEKEAVEKQRFRQRLVQLTTTAPVVVFIKGSPEQPRCKFSRELVDILEKAAIDFASFDVLRDRGVREGLKAFSDWPTFPQIYKYGTFFGGLDILRESVADLSVSASDEGDADAWIDKLVASASVVAFIKGTPQEPRCGFSRTLCQLLNDRGLVFSTFDVLSSPDLRARLKIYSNWPTFPQLYVNNSFVGGLDIVIQLHNDAADDDVAFKRDLGLLDTDSSLSPASPVDRDG